MGDEINETYTSLISDVISKQATILGPDIAVLKARSITGLKVSDEGKVEGVQGDPKQILEALIDAYVQLSGQIVKSTLQSVFNKYPQVETK